MENEYLNTVTSIIYAPETMERRNVFVKDIFFIKNEWDEIFNEKEKKLQKHTNFKNIINHRHQREKSKYS